MTMSQDNLSIFGELIASKLRDPAMDRFENLRKGNHKAPALQDLQSRLRGLDPETREIARRCVVSAVDSAIHDFLFSLQERGFKNRPIAVLVDGENIADSSDGLHGEIFGKDGWFAKFSAYGESPDVA
jgi:hypothetical protein